MTSSPCASKGVFCGSREITVDKPNSKPDSEASGDRSPRERARLRRCSPPLSQGSSLQTVPGKCQPFRVPGGLL